jgi:hypothetical protein
VTDGGTRRLRALLWSLPLLLPAAALQLPRPLLVNFGAGDQPFIHGFRDDWERDGLRQSGETMFRWTLDGGVVTLPVDVHSGRPVARLRVARFAATPAEIRILAGESTVAAWTQPPRGWRLRDVELGGLRGRVSLQFRSAAEAGDPLGVALDWIEVRGAGLITPAGHLLPGLLGLLIGVPLAVRLLAGGEAARVVAAGLGVLAGTLVAYDRLGGLVALSRAAAPLLIGVLALAGLRRGLRRLTSDPTPAPAGVALAATTLAALLSFHPFYYYSDVATHSEYLAALRADPGLLLDSTDYQIRTAAYTRNVGGRRVAFPYSPAFHVLAWPLAPLLGDVDAVKTVAVLAQGVIVFLVYALARAAGLTPVAGLVAQVLVVLMPVTASDLSLARYPTLLGRACDLALLLYLAWRLPQLRTCPALGLLLLAQASYTGSLFNVGALVAALVLLDALHGERRRALRLLGLLAASAAVVVAVLYGRFLVSFWRDILPHLRAMPPDAPLAQDPASWLALAAERLSVFYDFVFPATAAAGLLALRAAPPHAVRALGAALAAGLALLGLRFFSPSVFRDVKEVQFLAPAVAVASTATLGWLWDRGRWGRVAATGLLLAASAWSLRSAAALVAARFLAVGR